MKRVIHFLILSALLIVPQLSLADAFDARQIQQGSTMEVLVPKYDLTSVDGRFKDNPVLFYPVTRLPKFDEAISRAEFLELMFQNGDFGEVDISNVTDFPDVPSDHPYYEVIQKAKARGIVSGYTDGLFRPHTTITRGQIAKVLVEAFEPTPILEEAPEFADIPSDHYFHDYIQSAVRAKLFQGYPDGLMHPDRPINFSEAETVIRRAAIPETFTPLPPRDYFRGFAGVHRLSTPGTEALNLTLTDLSGETEHKSIPVIIHARDFPTISFSLPPSKTELFGKAEQDNTWTMIYGAMSNPGPKQLWEGEFIVPTTGEISMGFGDKTVINGAYAGSHFGIDYANAEGAEVYASNHGVVTLADTTPSYGNTVIVDHGQNVFTMYMHLSELKTEEGTTVQKGDLIGLMGSTGIATGPHLHFTVFIGKVIVDNEEWLEGRF